MPTVKGCVLSRLVRLRYLHVFEETSLSQFSAETSQKKDLTLQDISSKLRDAATLEVSSESIIARPWLGLTFHRLSLAGTS